MTDVLVLQHTGGAAQLVRAVDERAPDMLELGRGMFERFLDHVVLRAESRE